MFPNTPLLLNCIASFLSARQAYLPCCHFSVSSYTCLKSLFSSFLPPKPVLVIQECETTTARSTDFFREARNPEFGVFNLLICFCFCFTPLVPHRLPVYNLSSLDQKEKNLLSSCSVPSTIWSHLIFTPTL